nr:Ig-like domain-containing protein [Corallococcus sicarius]
MAGSLSLARRCFALILAIAVSACGNGTVPSERVASILISGASAEPIPANETVQLTAPPRDAAGNPVSRPVSWASSNSEVAEVSAQGLVTAVKPGDVVISASSERSSASVVVRVVVARVASVTLDGVPTGQVPVETTVQLSATLKDSRGATLSGRAVTWSSSDTSRAQVSDSGLVTALKAGQVTLTATSETKSASATLDLYVPVAQVTVSPSSAVIAVDQELQLRVELKDAHGNVLTGRTVEWVSSDASRAEVQANGKVTGRGEGTVTLTATREGKSAVARLRVIASKGSWNQTEEWATFQGNARHTGAVDATLDPEVFRELWVRPAVTGATALNPVTEGGGAVFVSTQSYFGGQLLAALDAQTGATLWTHSFGTIHAAHPPAYSDGAVYLTTSGHEDSFLYAFDAATGSIRFQSAYGNQWSHYYAPVVLKGNVFMAGGYYDGMYSFNATSGKQQWFFGTSQYDQWTPAVEGGRSSPTPNQGCRWWTRPRASWPTRSRTPASTGGGGA